VKIFFGFFVVLICVLIAFYLVFYRQLITNKLVINSLSTHPFNTMPTTTPFSLKEAPSESLKGDLTILQDNVFWQDRVSTESAKVSGRLKVQQGEKVETDKNGSAKIIFPDVLNISLFNNSSLNINQTLPVDLVFTLLKGSVRLEKTGKNSISAKTLHLLINIDGVVEVIILEDKPIIKVSVIQGSATLAYNNLLFETQSKKIAKGETILFNDSTRKVVQE
jgi:hypothetical protein